MSDIKNNDVFKSEVKREENSLELWEDCPLGDFVAEFETEAQLQFAATAINAYDLNQEYIASLEKTSKQAVDHAYDLAVKNEKQAETIANLEAWQRLAFDAHPNIDLDIEALEATKEIGA